MPDITTGLVAHWKFNENTGTAFADETANGNDGTLGSASWTTGYEGSAFNVNGASNSGVVPHSSEYCPTTEMSISIRLRTPETLNGYELVFHKESEGPDAGYGLYYNTDLSEFRFFLRVNGDWIDVGGAVPAANTTYMITATFDGDNLRLYEDDALVGTAARSGSIEHSTTDLYIGYDSAWGEGWPGWVDEFRIYDRELPLADVEMLYAWTGDAGPEPIDADAIFTEPNETVAATATVKVTGAGAFTEPNETVSSAAAVKIFASASISESAGTVSSTAAVKVVATASFTEPNETLSSSVSGSNRGNASFTEPNETMAATAAVKINALGSFTEPNETMVSAVAVKIGAAAGFTEANETLSSAVAVKINALAAFTEPNETLNSLVDTGVGFARRVGGRMGLSIRIGL